jgi:(R,R)-butanediol dehydrogenase/meso-butanediol dehydrogenase/diacetyl reductase
MTPRTMRAAVYHGRGDIRIEERNVPEPREGEVLLRVLRSGICGTDLGEFEHGPSLFPLRARHPVTGHQGPMTIGHEFTGEVVAHSTPTLRTPADAMPPLGTRVASAAGVWCGRCAWCAAGRTNLCADYWTLGLNADGGLAEYVRVPAFTCLEIPAACTDDAAGLAQPLAVGLHAVARGEIGESDTVVLVGAGAIGSFILCGLATRRPRQVIVLDIDDARLRTARRLGATRTVNVRDVDAVPAVRELTGGHGATVAIEATGAPGEAQRALDTAARGGRVILVGLPHAPQPLDLAAATLREIDIRTTVAHVCGSDLPAALGLLTDPRIAGLLLGEVISLDRLVPDGFAAMAARRVRGKILIDPAL